MIFLAGKFLIFISVLYFSNNKQKQPCVSRLILLDFENEGKIEAHRNSIVSTEEETEDR